MALVTVMRFVGSSCNISVMILTWGKIDICLKIGHKKAEFEYLFLMIEDNYHDDYDRTAVSGGAG